MPRGLNRRFLRHGLLLCTSALGTGFLGQYLFEVNSDVPPVHWKVFIVYL